MLVCRVPPVLGLTESAVVLNAVNVLFAAFVLIQIPYLFGGQLNIDLGKHDLCGVRAARVRRAGVCLGAGAGDAAGARRRSTRRETARQRTVFNLSSTIMVGLTLVMLVSAFKRLLLYEVAYGFTEMRVYPHVFHALARPCCSAGSW